MFHFVWTRKHRRLTAYTHNNTEQTRYKWHADLEFSMRSRLNVYSRLLRQLPVQVGLHPCLRSPISPLQSTPHPNFPDFIRILVWSIILPNNDGLTLNNTMHTADTMNGLQTPNDLKSTDCVANPRVRVGQAFRLCRSYIKAECLALSLSARSLSQYPHPSPHGGDLPCQRGRPAPMVYKRIQS